MQKEYIEREALLKDIKEMLNTAQQHINITGRGLGKTLWTGIYKGINFCQTKLLVAPAADVVEVRRGRWVWNENAMDWGLGGWVCSECRAKNDNIPAKPDTNPTAWSGSHYCPNCGALMDKDTYHEDEPKFANRFLKEE